MAKSKPKEGPPKKGPPKKGPPKKGPPKEGPPKEGPPKEGPPDQEIMDEWYKSEAENKLDPQQRKQHKSKLEPGDKRAYDRFLRLSKRYDQKTITWLAKRRDCKGQPLSVKSLEHLSRLENDELPAVIEHWWANALSSRKLDLYIRKLKGPERRDVSVLTKSVPGMVETIDNAALPPDWLRMLDDDQKAKLLTELSRIKDWSAGLLKKLPKK